MVVARWGKEGETALEGTGTTTIEKVGEGWNRKTFGKL